MNDLVKTEDGDWMSKKELMDFCKCSSRVLEQIISKLNCEVNFATQNHIKKGGYHNLETYYDDYLVKLIQAKLLSNKANQGNNSSIVKEIVKSAVKNGADWMSKQELMDFCKCSKTTLEQIISKLNSKVNLATQNHIKKGGYHNLETYYDDYLVKLIQAKLLSNKANQGNNSSIVKEIVKSAVKNELTKTLSKDEIKLELARNKTLQMQSQAQIEHEKAQKQIEHEKAQKQIEQYKAQKQIITEQERTKREQIRHEKEKEIAKRKETELELLRQKNINKKLKIKNFTEPLKKELKIMTKELAQQAVQAEYTKKLKQLDADGKYMLYIFYNPTNPTIYKIGKSNSLGNRLAIGTSENPNLTILYKKWCNCQMACDELEETIHQELRECNYNNYSDTGSKEWFVLTKEKLNEIVNKYEFIQSS